ncbi:hypothetical protein [Flagellimonas sp. 2504JD1-5]
MARVKVRCKESDKGGVQEHYFYYEKETVPGTDAFIEAFRTAIDSSDLKINLKKYLKGHSSDYEYLTCDQDHTHKYYMDEILEKTLND